jgi:hypothetical protein
MTAIKACLVCHTFKPFNAFYKAKTSKDGRMNLCIACDKARTQKYREANREKERVRNRDYGRRNAHVVRARVKRWRKENPGKDRAKRRMREIQKINACPPWARKGIVRKQIQAHYLHAEWLENTIDTPFHVDHIVPLCSDFVCGLHVPANLTVLEASQNIEKNNRWWPEQLPCQRGQGRSHAWWREMKANEHLYNW